MRKSLILTAFSLEFLSVNAQLQVTSTGRVNTLNQNVISASINNDMLDIVNSASNVSSGMDLIWTNYSLSQPNNPGLIKLSAVNTVKFVVKSNGYVGICKTTPSCALDVIGVGKINGSVILTSDERLKENIHELKDAKSSLLKLNGITFNFKSTTEQFEFLVNGEKNFFKDSVKMKVNEPDPEFYHRKHIRSLSTKC